MFINRNRCKLRAATGVSSIGKVGFGAGNALCYSSDLMKAWLCVGITLAAYRRRRLHMVTHGLRLGYVFNILISLHTCVHVLMYRPVGPPRG